MAIRYFFGRYIYDKFSHCMVNGFNLRFYAGCFDFNSLVHNCLNEVTVDHGVDDAIIRGVKDSLRTIVTHLKVNNTIIICTDGLVPQAKMNDQRARRYEFEEPIVPEGDFYRSSITPGTEFMKKLRKEMRIFLKKEKLAPEVIYSDDLVIGEGEQKIMQYFREWSVNKKDENFVIYGLDADLILLCLVSPLKNIYIKRDERNNYLDINMLRKAIVKEFTHEQNDPKDILHDFLILTFFIGNDFIKKIPYFHDLVYGMKVLTKIYKDNDICLTNNGKIDHSELRRLFLYLKRSENDILDRIKDTDTPYYFHDKFHTDWYKRCFLPRDDTLLKELGIKIVYDNTTIKEMVDNYIEMFYWVFRYYTKGMNKVSFNYCYKYLYPPLFSEVYTHMDKTNEDYSTYKLGSVIPSIATQMIYVLPPQLSHLVDKKIRYLYKDKYTDHMFPTKGHIDQDTDNEIIYTFDVMDKLDDLVRSEVYNTYNHTTENEIFKHEFGTYVRRERKTAMVNAAGGYKGRFERRK